MNLTNERLEAVLKLAAADPAYRPEFFQVLMNASVLVPGANCQAVMEASTALDPQLWEKEAGGGAIPFFTSHAAMKEALSDEPSYQIMPVRTLFEQTRGATLFLNPRLAAGKAFSAHEIATLLDKEESVLARQQVLAEGDTLLLSEVATPPTQIIDALTRLFTIYKPVRRAFVASVKESAGAEPNLLIGIEADSDTGTIINVAGQVATDTLAGDKPIDFCEVVAGQQGISHFFTAHITPFYERRWGSFLRDIRVKMV